MANSVVFLQFLLSSPLLAKQLILLTKSVCDLSITVSRKKENINKLFGSQHELEEDNASSNDGNDEKRDENGRNPVQLHPLA